STTGTLSGISVSPAAATQLVVSGFPAHATAGAAQTFTVTAEDAYGNVATGYRGTVAFTSRDWQATLPSSYTFTASDAGSHSFSATFRSAWTMWLTAADSSNSALS